MDDAVIRAVASLHRAYDCTRAFVYVRIGKKNPFFFFRREQKRDGLADRSLLDFIRTHIGIHLGSNSQCETGNGISITIAHCRRGLQNGFLGRVIRVIMLIKLVHQRRIYGK